MAVLTRTMKISVVKIRCTMSDDEGAGNDADMDRFNIYATPIDGLTAAAAEKLTEAEKQKKTVKPVVPLWNWSTSGEVTVTVGYDFVSAWNLNLYSTVDFKSSENTFDIGQAQLVLSVDHREYDTHGGDEYGSASMTLVGLHNDKKSGILDNEGMHTVNCRSADAGFDVIFKIVEVDEDE